LYEGINLFHLGFRMILCAALADTRRKVFEQTVAVLAGLDIAYDSDVSENGNDNCAIH